MALNRPSGRGPARACASLLAALAASVAALLVPGAAHAGPDGLVAAYSFDAGSGSSAADLSGNGNDGAIAGAAWTTGKHGGALSFDGASAYVTVADSASVDLTGGMTLEAWVYPTGSSGARTVIAKERAGGGFPYGLETNGGTPDGYVNAADRATASGASALPLSTWTHLATTYDGAAIRLYVNGALVDSEPASGSIRTSADPLRIGADLTWGEYFKGKIDDVRVYDRALSAAEVGTDMSTAVSAPAPPAPAGPVAAYAFDAGSGSSVADASGSGNTATLNGAAWITGGKFGGALSFDGTSDYVTVPDSSSLDLGDAMTLEAWVYPTGSGGWRTIAAKERSGGGFPYGLETNGGTPDGYVNTGTKTVAPGSAALPLNAWTHLASTYDGTSLRLYVNGALAATGAASGTIGDSADPLRIGADVVWGEYFQGRIDEVRVYDRALSASEIAADMTTAIGGSPPPPPPPPAGDTQAPSPPGGLAKTGATQTSVSVSWSPSTDDVGVAGYGLYRNGASTGSTTATAATFSGLACGTSYTLSVDAFDAAGNRSTKAALSAATSACSPSSGANVFVAPGGSDSNPCTQAAPCRSWNRAYQVARNGDTVQVAGGTYGDQNLLYDPSKAGSSSDMPDVVFRPAAGASVTVGQLDFGSNRFEGGAAHVTIQDMTVNGDVSIPGCGVPDNTRCPSDAQSPGNDLSFVNLRVKAPHAPGSWGGAAFYCASCSNVNIVGGVWGPDSYLPCHDSVHPEIQSAYTQVKRANHILIQGSTWQNFARCSSSDHTECLQVEPADDITLRGNVFRRCDTIIVNFANDLANSNSAAGYRAPNNVLIENNFFDTAADNTGGPTYYALNIRECTNCTIRNNSWTQPPRMPTGEVSLNVKFIANVGPYDQWSCLGSVTYSHNVFQGAACGPTDRNVSSLGFVNAGATDLHLTAGSPAIDAGDPASFPATDLDGDARPRGAAPDAGADER